MIGTSVFPQSFTVRRRSEFEFASLASKQWSRVGGSLAYNEVDRCRSPPFWFVGLTCSINWVKYFNAESQLIICIFMLILRDLFIKMSFNSFKVVFPV